MDHPNYPTNIDELNKKFSTEASCRDFLFKMKWPFGFICPKCHSRESRMNKNFILTCRSCEHHTSVIVDTIFERTHKPLTEWFRVLWWLASEKKGMRALDLKQLMITSYKTAWTWLHKIRFAMIKPHREMLNGKIILGLTPILDKSNILSKNILANKDGLKTKILIALEINDNNTVNRIIGRYLSDFEMSTVTIFVTDFIEYGSTVWTHPIEEFSEFFKSGYFQEYPCTTPKTETDLIETISSNIYRWLTFNNQKSINRNHLNFYLDEYCFKYNNKDEKDTGLLFYKLLQNAMTSKPLTLKTIRKDFDKR